MLQALQDGPITCGMQVTQQFEAQIGNCDVYQDPCTDCHLQDHDISIVGYGTDSKTNKDYWIVRNSWGTWWGCLVSKFIIFFTFYTNNNKTKQVMDL